MSEVLLNEVCELIVDCPHSTASDEGKGYPLVRTPNIGKGRLVYNGMHRVCEDVYNKRNARAVPQEDDLIFAREATAGNVALIQKGEKVCLGQRTVLIRPNQEKVNPAFLTYFLLAPKQQYNLLSTANGATVAHVNLPTIRNLKIDLPELPTQHRISTILSRYDSLIENYQKQLMLLDEVAQRLYKEWFVDLHFPGHENTKIVDGVPEGWEKKMIGEVCDTTSGGTPSRSKTEFYTGNIPWVKTKELNDDFIFDTEERITDDAIRKSSAKLIPSGSILMAMYGATIGKLGIATKELSCNQACCVFLLSEDNVLRFYLYSWLLDNRTLLISMGKGAAQPNLSQDMIKKLEIVIPSLHILSIFDSKVKSIYKKIYYLSSQIRLLTEARDRLLPKLMSGEIAV